MCGIAGFIQRAAPEESAAVLDRMKNRLVHRGPDGEGSWIAKRGGWTVALGHRRLSIIDVQGGAQPMANTEGSQIVFNGELFNFLDLKPQLESRGRTFSNRSDTEVVLQQIQEHGAEGLEDLNGMFGFAIWDSETSTLMLARDRSGIKPLFYAPLSDGGIAFASELNVLFEHPLVERKIDSSYLWSYFFSDYFMPPQTVSPGIFQLEPGRYLSWTEGKVSDQARYWSLKASDTTESVGESEKLTKLRSHLETSVRRQLISDVPVGVFLSGGIDSSLVSAVAASQKKEIQTFSIAFEEEDYDESPFAKVVAKHIGSKHTQRTLNESVLLDHLGPALDSLDQPMADPSIVPTFLLSKLASESVKVVLGGDGGDELWAGYPTYLAHVAGSYYEKLPDWLKENVFTPIVGRLPVQHRYQSFEWKAKRFIQRWDQELWSRHLRWMSNTDLPALEFAFAGFSKDRWKKVYRTKFVESDDTINGVLASDFQTYMVHSVLTKVDRAAMANSLEVRPPLLDNEMVQYAFSLPSELKLRLGYRGAQSKYLLKQVAESLLPADIVHRKKKGFGIPLATWLRGPLKDRIHKILIDSPVWESKSVKPEVFSKWNQEHQNRKKDQSRPLWALLVLDHWMKREGIS